MDNLNHNFPFLTTLKKEGFYSLDLLETKKITLIDFRLFYSNTLNENKFSKLENNKPQLIQAYDCLKLISWFLVTQNQNKFHLRVREEGLNLFKKCILKVENKVGNCFKETNLTDLNNLMINHFYFYSKVEQNNSVYWQEPKISALDKFELWKLQNKNSFI